MEHLKSLNVLSRDVDERTWSFVSDRCLENQGNNKLDFTSKKTKMCIKKKKWLRLNIKGGSFGSSVLLSQLFYMPTI